ncbi:MAG: GTPase HflX [Betaproteobacteria bacterium]|nr:GTPase HflX [Betaproteobacteria bacterium]NBY17262.1 GTPase HflX [Betaproteobacteria bacterium]
MNLPDEYRRALLIGVGVGRIRRDERSLDELAALASSAGIAVGGRIAVHRARPDPATFIGRGKVAEIGERLVAEQIDHVLFDHALTPIQQRNLEQVWGVKVVERIGLILEIFAQRARSHEGKLQVELAQVQHQATRLVRGWTHLERQQGGIGLRGGPGEKQIELDRRMLDNKIRQLRTLIDRAERQRLTRRRQRLRQGAFSVSLVGYTNAGKSTLFNALTRAGTHAADQLFATLDTLTRKLHVADPVTGSSSQLVLSDTVGFIRDLPHTLVAAFRATLQETAGADLLLHVVDWSSPERDEQSAEVDRVLAEIGAAEVPLLVICNKIDETHTAPGVERDDRGTIRRVFVSARTGSGLDGLRVALAELSRGARFGAEIDADLQNPKEPILIPGLGNKPASMDPPDWTTAL